VDARRNRLRGVRPDVRRRGEGETFGSIADRIPAIAELGVDTLWLTPVLQHDGKPHGYNITDFFDVAEDLGERDDYEALVETAHDHGMRVLFDFVANHTARDHEWVRGRLPESGLPVPRPLRVARVGRAGDVLRLGADREPEPLEPRGSAIPPDVVDEWAPLVDGFRCDMAWAVPDSFWRELRDRVKDIDREFLLMDETIPYIPGFHEGMFDVHFDATLYFQLRQIGRGVDPAMSLLDAIDQRAEIGFPDHAEFLQYIENHDETRYRVECGDDAAAAAGGDIHSLPGVPMIYAGQEIGQRGRRDAIAWDHAREGVRDRYERLIAVREAHPALGPEGDLDRVGYHVASGDVSRATDRRQRRRSPRRRGGVPSERRGRRVVVVVLQLRTRTRERLGRRRPRRSGPRVGRSLRGCRRRWDRTNSRRRRGGRPGRGALSRSTRRSMTRSSRVRGHNA